MNALTGLLNLHGVEISQGGPTALCSELGEGDPGCKIIEETVRQSAVIHSGRDQQPVAQYWWNRYFARQKLFACDPFQSHVE